MSHVASPGAAATPALGAEHSRASHWSSNSCAARRRVPGRKALQGWLRERSAASLPARHLSSQPLRKGQAFGLTEKVEGLDRDYGIDAKPQRSRVTRVESDLTHVPHCRTRSDPHVKGLLRQVDGD
eukprot:scaffold24568_cov70-Phaeocystis_antarctica.AAC.8